MIKKNYLESTALKYQSVFAQLSFSFTLTSKYQENSIENAIFNFQFHIHLFYFKANLNLIRNTYMEFICISQYHDALIIHLMYSISLVPDYIYSLRYEDTFSKNIIQYLIINLQKIKFVIFFMSFGVKLI